MRDPSHSTFKVGGIGFNSYLMHFFSQFVSMMIFPPVAYHQFLPPIGNQYSITIIILCTYVRVNLKVCQLFTVNTFSIAHYNTQYWNHNSTCTAYCTHTLLVMCAQGQSLLAPPGPSSAAHTLQPYRTHTLALPKTYVTRRGTLYCSLEKQPNSLCGLYSIATYMLCSWSCTF